MNAYEATMKAADWIERNPQQYDFAHTRVPQCGTPGCMLGWIGVFAGMEVGTLTGDLHAFVGAGDPLGGGSFYDRCQSLIGDCSYVSSPVVAARAMRLYAAKYLAKPEQPTPDWNAIATAGNAYTPAAVTP